MENTLNSRMNSSENMLKSRMNTLENRWIPLNHLLRTMMSRMYAFYAWFPSHAYACWVTA